MTRRTLRALGKLMGLASVFMLMVTPFIHLFAPVPEIKYVVGGQLVTLAVSIFIHGGTEFLVDGVLWDSPDRQDGVPEDPTELIEDSDD